MKRLSNATLASLPPGIERPTYDRSAVTPGIVHLGIGAFHRAHQAAMTETRIAAGEMDWGIIAASLRSPDTANALNPQDGLYTLAVRDGVGTRYQVIGSVLNVLVAPYRDILLEQMENPGVRIVSLTVTEKGYCHDPATGELNEKHPSIIADLANPRVPTTAPGILVEALRRRRAAGVKPFTVLCCDNLPANGETVRRVVSRHAQLVDADLGAYVANEVAFPSTMVDRIVPATTDADRRAVASVLGVEDAWPVMTEPFCQWVIEDRFSDGRPRWEEAGAEFATDVAAFEKMKLRLLNGTHSTMAYLGQLAGLETIADTIGNPAFEIYIRRLMDEEISPTVPGFTPERLTAYKGALIARYQNPALRHRTAQIAMDGSQKVPQRLMSTIREQIAAGRPIALLSLSLAGFLRFMCGTGEKGQKLPVNDPMADKFTQVMRDCGAAGIALLSADDADALAARLAPAMLAISEVFSDTGTDPRLVGPVQQQLAKLLRDGAINAVTSS